MPTADRTLVAVFDAAHVRFFEYKPLRRHLDVVLADVASGLHHDRRAIETDKPGRGFGGDGQHHAYESEHDPRKLEKHDFVRAIAQAIEAALDAHKFTRLALVAPPRAIGEFRVVASAKVRKSLWRELAKELTQLSDTELRDHLVPFLQKPEL